MEDDFKTIVITAPDRVEDEARKIEFLLDKGISYIHIRKPGWTASETGDLIETISHRLHNRLKLHDNFDLCRKYALGGIHLNSRNTDVPQDFDGKVSRSCHSIDEIPLRHDFEYLMLSPVFDSISKEGYKGCFQGIETGNLIRGRRVVALGGVKHTHIPLLKEWGYAGAALLGDVWQNPECELWK